MNAPQQQLMSCEFCGGEHDSVDCQVSTSFEQANFMGNFQRGQNNFQRPMQNQFQNRPQNRFPKPQANLQNDPYAPTYNLGWRQHPNFSYKNTTQGPTQPPPGFQAPQALQKKKSDLEDLIRSYITSNEQKWTKQEVFNKNMEASIRNLENQVGQLANNLSRRPQGGLPSNTDKNPREEVNAVTLRSGKELEEVEEEPRKVEKGKKVVEETPNEDDTKSSKPAPEAKP